MDLGEPFLDLGLLAWKYLIPRPDWEGTRSFIIEEDGAIVSHFCLCPAIFRSADREVSSMTAIDWAADRRKPGSGIKMFHLIKKRVDTIFAIGGTKATLAVIPKVGFRYVGEFCTYRKSIRPWAEFSSTRKREGIAYLRLVRNLATKKFRTSLGEGTLQVEPIPRFSAFHEKLMDCVPNSFTTCRRTVGVLNYMLACPTISYSAYLLKKSGRERGYFLISRIGREARIVDISIDSDDPMEWKDAYAAATETAAQIPEVHNVFSGASVPLMVKALESNGYLPYRKDPVMIYDPSDILSPMPRIAFQMFEGDAGYYYSSK